MDADRFVEGLWACAPSIESLEAEGLSRAEAEEYRDSYRCKKRPCVEQDADPLLNLIRCYDASDVEIGMVSFSSGVTERGSNFQVGEVEADPLLINRATGEVWVEELGAPGYVLYRCAENGSKFLDALLLAACFISHAEDHESPEGQDAACKKAKECADAAGGDQFYGFYYMLLGCEQ
jgi:hypothetical protein